MGLSSDSLQLNFPSNRRVFGALGNQVWGIMTNSVEINGRAHAGLVILTLASLAAAFQSIVTANYGLDQSNAVRAMRLFSFPAMAIEMACIAIAMLDGVSLFAIFNRFPRWSKLALFVLIATALGTAAFAYADPVSAQIRTFAWLLHFLFGCTFFGCVSRQAEKLRPETAWQIILLGLVFFLFCLILFVAAVPDVESFRWQDFNFGVTNVRQLGFYAAVGASLGLGLSFTVDHAKQQYAYGFVASLMFAIAVWSGTRSAVISVIATLFAVGIFAKNGMKWNRLFLTSGLVIFGGSLFGAMPPVHDSAMGFWRLFRDSAQHGANEVTSGRTKIWRGTVREITKKPIFGHGESQFRHLVKENNGIMNHPHNSILQMLFQWGFAGAACFFALFGSVWLRVRQVAISNPRLGLPGFMVISSMFAMSMMEGSLYHFWPVMMIVMAVAWVLGMDQAKHQVEM